MSNTYTPTIGLEIHAELNTKSKMFCGCKNDPHVATPNIYVCPVCMGHPGTLPVVNELAVQKLLVFGQAVGATLATYSEFDRKNYFYPDIPKAYQISQYAYPLVQGGNLAGVALTRVHLEEDTARSQHDKGVGSLVNFNRAGVPLMELVTEPVIHDAKTAGDFARELQLILRTLKISDANMERGEMRVEANISVSKTSTFGTKVEVKNLNSFRSVESAIDYEIERHIRALESGEELIQETRGWDEVGQKTFSQRVKETAMDYRYFPDPDIPKLDITSHAEFSPSRLDDFIVELPSDKRSKYSDFGISDKQVETVLQSEALDTIFQAVIQTKSISPELVQLAANYLTSDVVSLLATTEKDEFYTEKFVTLLTMFIEDELNSRAVKDLLAEVLFEGAEPANLAEARGLLQKNDSEALLPIVQSVLADNPTVVAEFVAGKESVLQFLVGQGMKATKGAANPKLLAELIKNEACK